MLTEGDKAWIEQQFELAGGRPIEPAPKQPISKRRVAEVIFGAVWFGLIVTSIFQTSDHPAWNGMLVAIGLIVFLAFTVDEMFKR